MTNPNPTTQELDEARKLLENWKQDLQKAEKSFPGCLDTWSLNDWEREINKLLAAQRTITEHEVRKECAEIVKRYEYYLLTEPALAAYKGIQHDILNSNQQ